MFEQLTEADERGQVGIGTLIVFIAMVLVAAIAAGVLINTAGTLQTQASDTGSETQEAVANQIEVVHATGNVTEDTHDGTSDEVDVVDEINLTVMKSAGSDAIDLTSMTLQYTSSNNDETLVYNDTDRDSAESDEFTTDVLYEDGAGDSESLISTDDRVQITIDVGGLEENGADGLEGGESATLTLTDQSGAQFTYGVSVPSTFGNQEVVEV